MNDPDRAEETLYFIVLSLVLACVALSIALAFVVSR